MWHTRTKMHGDVPSALFPPPTLPDPLTVVPTPMSISTIVSNRALASLLQVRTCRPSMCGSLPAMAALVEDQRVYTAADLIVLALKSTTH